jgi:translocation and assembly module TamB
MSAVISFSSALGGRLAFRRLTLEHPVVHLIFYADGSINQPAQARKNSDFEQIFSLSARRLEVQHGALLWQDQRIPFDFSTRNVAANLSYSFLRLRYSGNIAVEMAENQFAGLRPIAWSGQARFNLDRTGLQVQSMQISSESSQVKASNLNFDFHSLTFRGKYDLSLDLQQLAAVTRQQTLQHGRLRLEGNGSWSPKNFASSGTFALTGADWRNREFSGRDLSLSGAYSVDANKLAFSKIEGQFARGTLTGDAEVTNWQAPASAQKQQAQEGILRISSKNLSVSEILSGLGPGFAGLDRLRFSGSLSSNTEIRWRQSPKFARASADWSVKPLPKTSANQVPLTSTGRATYDFRSDDFLLNEFSANTPASEIRATGSPATAVRFSFVSTYMREWQPVITQLVPSGTPVIVNGRAAFNGTASGKSSNLRLAGNLQISDFDTVTAVKGVRRQVHWDSMNADLQASPVNLSLRNAVLQHADAIVKLSGNANLSGWNFEPENTLRFHVSIQNVEAGELAALGGYDREMAGKLSGEFQLSGSRQKPQGQGEFHLIPATIHGQALDSVSASLSLNGTEASVENLRIARGQALITGDGVYDLSSTQFQFALRGGNFNIVDIAAVKLAAIKFTGQVDFSARVSGTTKAPQVTADVEVRNLSLNDQLEGNFLLNAVSRGSNVRITGRSNFKDAELQVDGTVQLHEQWPTHIDAHFSRLNADPFVVSYLHNRVVKHSLIAGDVAVDGPLFDGHRLRVSGGLSDLYAEAGKTSFRNDGPIHFALSEQAFSVDKFHVLGENSDFFAGGSMRFTGDRAVDFQMNGKVDLKVIQSYDSDITSSGTISGDGRVTGTLDAPLVKGKLQIDNGAIADINLPSALSDINGRLLFSQNQVTIESLNARVGGGAVGFKGHAELVGRQLNFDLNASADSVRLRYPPGVSSTANAALRWSGSSSGSLLAGDIIVNKLAFTPGFDFGAYLERTAQISSLPQTDPVLNTIRLDLHVSTAPELQMQTSVIRLQGSADLRVRGSAAKPILLGRADVFEGQAYFNGTKYRLERGGVSFSNPAVTTPFLDLEAVTRVRDYDITLSLTGDISKPNGLKVNYRSDPPLPTADIIALLAFGQTTEESAQLQQGNQSAFSAQASSAMLTAALNATLNNRAQRLFGNSRIKIDPQGLESETSTITQSGPAVTIEQQVKDNLTVSYTTDVSQTSQQVIRAEYNVSKNVSIVAIRDQNGVVSFDVKIRRRKR